ncbi:hypothetical protein HMPREF9952_2039 [Haemophilus pittmaniae HK 85]|uniref:Uncharacterized protein n=1 Tax=Haemophilus pittmaniae HK 85 TaxID=1035188 RepID=F9QBW5_9PAST|nr:hypothetical protein HMPREF9952_2039 [Haemophilus pittmaniae HK 85]
MKSVVLRKTYENQGVSHTPFNLLFGAYAVRPYILLGM